VMVRAGMIVTVIGRPPLGDVDRLLCGTTRSLLMFELPLLDELANQLSRLGRIGKPVT
jgi:hypothetical protein